MSTNQYYNVQFCQNTILFNIKSIRNCGSQIHRERFRLCYCSNLCHNGMPEHCGQCANLVHMYICTAVRLNVHIGYMLPEKNSGVIRVEQLRDYAHAHFAYSGRSACNSSYSSYQGNIAENAQNDSKWDRCIWRVTRRAPRGFRRGYLEQI